MKIGLLTFHRSDNIGAMLQAYALQTALVSAGAKCEFVDFPVPDGPVLTDYFSSNMRNADFFVRKVADEGRKRHALFDGFRAEYLKISKVHSDTSQLNDEYDLFIAGSDQIWNFSIEDTDERYFLPFADERKRYSYAASFGGDMVPAKKRAFVSEQLSRFQKISVREESGVSTIADLTGREAVICTDPVFLLTSDEWLKLANESHTGQDYVFVYMIQYSKTIVDEAKAYALEHGCNVRTMISFFTPKVGFEAWSSFGVRDFVTFIAGARKVFTNSFHGTAFSIIFDKDFTSYPLTGELKDRSERVAELMAVRNDIESRKRESWQYLKGIVEDCS